MDSLRPAPTIIDEFNDRSALGNRILQLSKDSGVSDFYVTPWESLVARRNGKLFYDSFIYQPMVQMEMQAGTKDYAVSMGGRRFRVNRMATRGRLRWVLRLLPENIPAMEGLALPPAAIKAFLEAKNGLFLVCGSTGSGKSTTIASMVLERAKRRPEHIITFEDPIEYLYPAGLPSLVSQREIGSDELDFGMSLRAALRQAPDVIVVGEIRDGETAEIALAAAETGHVVVATMHTSTAAQTVQRYLKLIPSDRVENAMISFADCFKGILCQRLLFDEEKGRRFAIHELLLPYDSVCGSIRRGEFKKLDHELEAGMTRGMLLFERSLQQRVNEGWKPAMNARPTGFAERDVYEFMEREQLNTLANAAA